MSSFQAGALAAYVDYGFAAVLSPRRRRFLKCRPEVEAQVVDLVGYS